MWCMQKRGRWKFNRLLPGLLQYTAMVCSKCMKSIHYKCFEIVGILKEDLKVVPILCHTPLPLNVTNILTETLNKLAHFSILGTCWAKVEVVLTQVLHVVTCSTWKKLWELLPILTNRGISLLKRVYVYSACVRSPLLYASETWPLTARGLPRVHCNENDI
jgi:hypothetical protein